MQYWSNTYVFIQLIIATHFEGNKNTLINKQQIPLFYEVKAPSPTKWTANNTMNKHG